MAYPPPTIVGHGADQMKLMGFIVLAEQERKTHGDSLLGFGSTVSSRLAIMRDVSERSYYLFTCDDTWRVMFDTNHASLEDALHQSEYQYAGTRSRWKLL